MQPLSGVRLQVVLDRSVAVYSGMVPGFVAGDYDHHELEIDVLPLARRAQAGVILAAATDLDPVRRKISLEGRPPISYDFVSLDVGSTVRGLELPGVREHALATRPIGRFVREIDERLATLARLDRPPRILIVGGGAAGAEIAFTLDARLRANGLAPRISIVSSDSKLLSGAATRTRRALEREALVRKIEGVFDVRVVRVDAAGLLTRPAESNETGEETHHAADLVIWATGAAPVAFPQQQGIGQLATDEAGFIEVRDTLQAVGFEEVFAVGDCARLVEHRWIPRAGVYAVRQGPTLEHNLRALVGGRPLRRYRPQRDFLSLLNLGGRRAIGTKWGRVASGKHVYALKDRIDRRFMQRFQLLDESGRPRPGSESIGSMGGSRGEAEAAEMACGGCAAKLGALPLSTALARLPKAPPDSSVLLGLDARDDVAATRDDRGKTTLHNIDVIRSFCDDPWLVGRVAASNALSDLYAKGGRPRHAQATIGLPDLEPAQGQELLFQTLSGLRTTLDALGVSLLGGHTTIGDELSVGLAVSGDGPEGADLLRQAGARPGDELWLTQPIGTGVILAADMQGLARSDWVLAAYAAMQHTNDVGGQIIAREPSVRAATDVTGFGLAGHLLTLLDPEGLVAEIDRSALPLLSGAELLWESGLRSTAHPANREAFTRQVSGATESDEAWLFDPQTAGGLLLAIEPHEAQRLVEDFASAGEPPVVPIGRIRSDRPSDESATSRGRIEIVG
jgi:selenide,water dikinase